MAAPEKGRRAYVAITIPCGPKAEKEEESPFPGSNPPPFPNARAACTASTVVSGREGLSSKPSARQERRMSSLSSAPIRSPGATGPVLKVAMAASRWGLASCVSGP